MSPSPDPRVIKRYANRKLYDMSESRYITHEEIAHLVRGGEEVRIIDNRTQEDLTSSTLTQILLDEERRIKRPLPIDTLRNFFQSGGDFIQRHIKQPVANLREEAEKNVRRVFGKRDERSIDPPAKDPRELAGGLRPKPTDALRDAFEERWLELSHSVAQLDFPRRIAELEKRVEALEAELTALRSSGPSGDQLG
jgi:polyhydroxyalkanoate synthesis repressor PhaR